MASYLQMRNRLRDGVPTSGSYLQNRDKLRRVTIVLAGSSYSYLQRRNPLSEGIRILLLPANVFTPFIIMADGSTFQRDGSTRAMITASGATYIERAL